MLYYKIGKTKPNQKKKKTQHKGSRQQEEVQTILGNKAEWNIVVTEATSTAADMRAVDGVRSKPLVKPTNDDDRRVHRPAQTDTVALRQVGR